MGVYPTTDTENTSSFAIRTATRSPCSCCPVEMHPTAEMQQARRAGWAVCQGKAGAGANGYFASQE